MPIRLSPTSLEWACPWEKLSALVVEPVSVEADVEDVTAALREQLDAVSVVDLYSVEIKAHRQQQREPKVIEADSVLPGGAAC